MIEFNHVPVMLNECISGLNIEEGNLCIDATAGGGGHSLAIAKKLGKTGKLVCIDKDADAIQAAKQRLFGYDNVSFVHADFFDIGTIMDNLGILYANGILFDLGVSSYQLDEPSRGFSFLKNAPLDMRMDREASLSAHEVINEYSEKALADLFYRYGEEKFSLRIARLIVAKRKDKPITSTLALADIVSAAIPRQAWEKNKHPATRVFQAVRIEVNNELGILEDTIKTAVKRLLPGGRICVITFHSLEDRIIKNTFRDMEKPCSCPRDFPVCVCYKQPLVKLVSRKPIVAKIDELAHNPRARSAKLRIAEKLPLN